MPDFGFDDKPPYLDDDPGYRAAARRYDALADAALRALVNREHAVVWPEVEAKLADRPQDGAPRGIDPHHLTNARRRLVAAGVIEEVPAATRGGRVVAVYGLRDRRRRQTAFDRTARRKRLLQTRYLGWSEASGDAPNLIGAGGEAVTRASLREAAAAGACLAVGGATGEVGHLLGAPVPGGALDAAAQYVLPDPATAGLVAATALVEVKNLRGRIYPAADELFQLLDKAARLQAAHPQVAFVPVLVCRRAHYLTFVMAKHLGCFVVEFDLPDAGWPQPLLPHWTAPPAAVLEVREGLGYLLARTDNPTSHLVRQFRVVIPRQALAAAHRWATTGPALATHFRQLRDERLTGAMRDAAMDGLYRAACRVVPPHKPWRHRMAPPAF